VLRKNLSLLLFLIIFVWVYGWSNLLVLYTVIELDSLRESFKEYVLCNAAMEDNCVNRHPYPTWMMYVFIVTVTNVGVFIFLLYGFQRKVALHWKKIITIVIRGDLKSLTDLSIESYEKSAIVSKVNVAKQSS